MPSGSLPSGPYPSAVLVQEFRSERPNSVLGLTALAAVCVWLFVTYRDTSNPVALGIWAAWMFVLLGVWGAAIIVSVVHEPSDALVLRLYAPAGRLIMTGCNLATAASVWIFLPPLDGAERLFLIPVYYWYIITQALGATRATEVVRSAILLVFGSLIAFELATPGAHSTALVVIHAACGATILALRRLVRRTAVDAAEARALAEERAVELERALRLITEQRDDKTRFIASASHDLQQPIYAASLFLEQVVVAEGQDRRDAAAAGARAAFASVQKLLAHMLDHLRLEAGAVAVQREPVSLALLFARIRPMAAARLSAAGTSLQLVTSSLVVSADALLLERIIGNLVENAARHAGASRLLLGARLRDRQVEIWIIDDGRGLSADMRPRAFEDYAQATGTVGGFGLGLSSARRMARAMGGELVHEPGWAHGAAFRLSLPGYRPAGLAAARLSPREEAACEAA